MRSFPAVSIGLLLLAEAAYADSNTTHGLRVPAGFTVTEIADGRLAADVHCMTVDPSGRVTVSGRGYLRILVVGGGRAVRALDFAAPPEDGAHGLLWDNGDLYCVGGGGLRRYRQAAGAGRKRPSEILFRCKTGGEHTAHAVRRGPDGWLYLLAGDGTQIDSSHATLPTSPVKEPTGGCVLRFPPDFEGCEIVAHGFRNPYGMDFNRDGELFTFDSDNERCVSLPWYEPTRCYHVQPGGHHGWLARQVTATWRRPPYFLDTVPPVATLGRGSPTGVVCYRHAQFPERYRGGLFLLDWTFGVVHFVPLDAHGSSYRGKPEVFLRSVGDNGFAPTAAAVDPVTGDLYVSIGGRGTRGAVYRIRHEEGLKRLNREEVSRWQPAARSLDWKPGLDAELVKAAGGKDAGRRRQALEMIARHRARFSGEQLERVILACAGETDRGIRRAAARLLASLDPHEQTRIGKRLTTPLAQTTRLLARPSLEAVSLVANANLPSSVRLDAVRLVQLAAGDSTASGSKGSVREGYTRRRETAVPESVRATFRAAFPSGDADLDRELTRTLAMLEDDNPSLLGRTAARLTARSHPVEDVHYLIVLSRLKGPRGAAETRATADALLALGGKLDGLNLARDTNWPLRMRELHADLAARDLKLNAALVGHPEFGRPDHAIWCRAPGFERTKAAAIFLKRSAEEGFAWNADLVNLVGELPAEKSLPALRRLWGEQGFDEVILPLLAGHAIPEDRGRFVTSLTSARLDTVKQAITAVEKLSLPDGKGRKPEALALARALRQLPAGKEEDALRVRLLARLEKHAGEKLAGVDAASAWLARKYPDAAGKPDGEDLAGWKSRLAKITWDRGDAKRGQAAYVKASCASCHSGAAALGPDLRGIAGRFSRADLFAAILQPGKDVSPRYRTTQLTTSAGRVYQGIIVYEAADSVLMLTGPGQNVRLAHRQISERKLTPGSLMPAGLLGRLKDEEIADLYAYLRSLGAR